MTSFVANERLESSCYETTLCVGSPVFSFHTEPHRSALNKERWPITRNINQWFINWNRSSRFCALLFIPVRPRTNECWTRLCEKRTQKRRSNSLVECVSLGDRRVAQFAYEDDLCRCAPTDSIERHDSAIFVVEPSLLCKWALRWPSGPWPVLLLVGCVPFLGLFGALFWRYANEAESPPQIAFQWHVVVTPSGSHAAVLTEFLCFFSCFFAFLPCLKNETSTSLCKVTAPLWSSFGHGGQRSE